MRGLQIIVLYGALVISIMIVGCERQGGTPQGESEDIRSERVDLASPERTVHAWYRSWNQADKDLLDRVMLHGAPKSVSFVEGDTIKYEVVSIEELGADLDKSQHRKAKKGDVVIITREYAGADSTGSTKKYLLLRRQGSEWKVVTYSLIRGKESPPLPEEL